MTTTIWKVTCVLLRIIEQSECITVAEEVETIQIISIKTVVVVMGVAMISKNQLAIVNVVLVIAMMSQSGYNNNGSSACCSDKRISKQFQQWCHRYCFSDK